jgi:peptidyl-prolyl cis-trans isomerase A (cyclophilin A)
MKPTMPDCQKAACVPHSALTVIPSLEALESRLLLDAAPTFATPLADTYYLSDTLGKAITLGIDGADADGDALTITATSDDPRLVVTTRAGQQTFARLNFKDGSGNVIGSVVVQLFGDVAPQAVQRFINLATKAVVAGAYATPDATHSAFYTNVLVHRLIPNFMIQTGDAVNGTGTGGSGLSATATGGEAAKFGLELDTHLSFTGPGVLAMANTGAANSNDCQFFLTTYGYASGDGKYTIFGQIVSGQDVADKISLAQRNSSDKPYNAIKLASVDIITNDTQDATATMYATSGFDGHATVTVRLQDGTGQVTTKQIAVNRATGWGDRPAVSNLPATLYALPGQTQSAHVTINDSTLPAGTLDVNASTDVAGVNVSVAHNVGSDYLITYSLPADYAGASLIPVKLTTREHALAGVGDMPAKVYMTYLTTFGERPVISGIADDEVVQMQPGTTITKTITITDDSHSANDLTVTISKTSTTSGVTTTILPGNDPNTWNITLTVPATYMTPAVAYLNGFNVTVSAVENATSSNITLTPTTKTFHVTTLGARPTIGLLDDVLVLAPGEKRDVPLAISDDSSLDLNVTATSSINGTGADQQVVTLDSQTVNGAKVYTLHVDLTKRLPANFTGYFKVSLSAVEKVASASDTTIKDAAKPATRDIYVAVQYPGDPELPDGFKTKNDAQVAVVDGQKLYVGTTSGVEVYDLSAGATQPTYLGKFDTPSEVHDLIVQGNTLFVAVYGTAYGTYISKSGEVLALDVSDPAKITKLNEVFTDSTVDDLELVGTNLYVANFTKGLVLYDVTHPAAITEEGVFLSDTAGHALSQAVAVEVSGNYAYVADSGSPGRLVVLNIQDPQNITFVREMYTSRASYLGRVRQVTQGQPSGLALEGNRLYVSDAVNGLFIYDITQPALPVQLGWGNWKSGAVRVQGNLAVLAYGGYHIVLDVTDPQNIMKMYAMYSPGYSGPEALAGDYAYLPSTGEGVATLNLAELVHSDMVDKVQNFVDDAGHRVTVEVIGAGEARVQQDAHGHLTQINVTSTNATSRLILLGSAGASVDDVYVAGSVGNVVLSQVTLAGDLVVQGQPRVVSLGNVTHQAGQGEQTIRFAASDATTTRLPVAFSAGRLSDVQIDSDYPISSFTAVDWRDDEGNSAADVDKLTAPSVGLLRITGASGAAGDFQADLDINSDGAATAATVLKTAIIAGDVSHSDWDINGTASLVQFDSAQDWTAQAQGRMLMLRAGNVAGTLSASSFGSILASGTFSAAVTASGQTGGVSIASFQAGNADQAAINVPGGVAGIYVGQWTTGSLTAGWVGSLLTHRGAGATGDMGATLDVTSTLTSARIAGDLSGQWTLDAVGSLIVSGDMDGSTLVLQRPAAALDLGMLDVRGWIRDSRILAAGRVGSVAAGGMDGSDLYAGYIGAAQVTGLPTAAQLGDTTLFDHLGAIQSVLIRGIRSGGSYADSFVDSGIAGWTIGSARLAYATVDPQSDPIGVAAHALSQYSYRDATPAHIVNWTSASAGAPPAVDNLIVRLV